MRLVLREPRSPPPASLHSGDMADPLFDAVERAQLSDLFDELGPGAPTLLAPWTTRTQATKVRNTRTAQSPPKQPRNGLTSLRQMSASSGNAGPCGCAFRYGLCARGTIERPVQEISAQCAEDP